MLARALPGVAVVVGASRYRAGRLAERELGATVHVLDDGFQHLQLERDVDLLLLSEDDLSDRPLPGGRLREPLTAAAVADAALVSAGYPTRRRPRGASGRDSDRVSGDPHARGAAHDREPVRVGRRAVAVARVCGGRRSRGPSVSLPMSRPRGGTSSAR